MAYPKLIFQPVSFSWVALHPNPKGVIQFIGGAFFGSFPTLFYRHLLNILYAEGYTLVVLPFRFSFRHWQIALGLLDEQQRLKNDLPQLAQQAGYATQIYYQSDGYHWLGHSLGCKYIALLELLCSLKLNPNSSSVEKILNHETIRWLHHRLTTVPTIWNQPSLLIAPDISDTQTAIPIKCLANWLETLGLGVQPTRQETLELIEHSHLFNLTTMISYEHDTVAGSIQDSDPSISDVLWLYKYLLPKRLRHTELPGKHLEPIGVKISRWLVDFNPMDKFIKPLMKWPTGESVLAFWDDSQQ